MSERVDEESDQSYSNGSSISLMAEAATEPATSIEASSSAASSPSPVCGGPSQPGSESMSLEISSGEDDIMVSSSPSPDGAGPSQKVIHPPSNRWGGVPPLKPWTSPELLTEMLDSDSSHDRSVIPKSGACLGDGKGLTDVDDDDDDFWKMIRELKVAIAGKSELNQDLEDNDDSYLKDDKSLLEAFRVTRPRRRPVTKFAQVLPACEEMPEEDQETSGVTPQDSEQSLEIHLEPEPPHQDSTPAQSIHTPDGSSSSSQQEQQTPAQQLLLLQDQAVDEEEEAAGGRGGRWSSVKEFCTPLRRLSKNLRRLLGRNRRKVEPLNMAVTQDIGQQARGLATRSQRQNAPRRTGLRRILSCVCCCCK
ncbi:uncharacterized protein LOC134463110 isoform X2 [Engraulis encrasicolus]